MKNERKAIFKNRGFAHKLAHDLDVDVEVIENLDGKEVIVMQEVCPGYYDIRFPTYFAMDGKVFTIEAISIYHLAKKN